MKRALVTALVFACLLVAVVSVFAMAMEIRQQEFIIEMLLWKKQYRPVPLPGMESA